MKIIHIFLISCLSVIGVKTDFQPGAVTSPSQAPLPAAGFPNYYMAKGETVTKADFEEIYFSATSAYTAPIISNSIAAAIEDKINSFLTKHNSLNVYVIVKEEGKHYVAFVKIMDIDLSQTLYVGSNISLTGKTPSVIKGLKFPVGDTVPKLIKFIYQTSKQQESNSCYISFAWDSGSNGYVGGFVFYSPLYKTQPNMKSAVGSIISYAQQQNSQIDSAGTIVKSLAGAGFKDSDDWTQYVCSAFQAQAPTDPSATNSQGTLTKQQQLQQSQLYVDKIAKAFGNGVGCTLTLASVSPQS